MTVRAAVTLSLLALAAGCAIAQDENLVLDKPYASTAEVLSGWTGLVDGVADSDSGPGCFATVNDPAFPKYVTIDLQRPCLIKRIAVHNSANGNTRHITIAVSADGKDYERLREFIFPQGQAMPLNHRFEERRAQFVRIGVLDSWGGGLGGDHCVFLREVEVFGMPTGEPGVKPPAAEPEGEALLRTRALRLFKRYALDVERDLKIVAMGDSLAAGGEESWPALLAVGLADLRPLGTETTHVSLTELGIRPGHAMAGMLDELIAEDPDIVLVTFGSDYQTYVPRVLRRDMAELLERMSVEVSGLLVLVGPALDQDDEERVDTVRGVARELAQTAQVMGLPMLRTERALLDAGVEAACETDPDDDTRRLSEQARHAIAEALVELLTQ
jgi:hypothetical protein